MPLRRAVRAMAACCGAFRTLAQLASVSEASPKASHMKKTTTLAAIALLLLAARTPREATAITADTPEPVELPSVVPLSNREVVEKHAAVYSAEYGVSYDSMMRTLYNENNAFEPCLQSGLTYKPGNRWGFEAGTREQSFGVAQIHIPDNPGVTKEEACDPDFAVRFMAEAFSKGHQKRWMGYRG